MCNLGIESFTIKAVNPTVQKGPQSALWARIDNLIPLSRNLFHAADAFRYMHKGIDERSDLLENGLCVDIDELCHRIPASVRFRYLSNNRDERVIGK